MAITFLVEDGTGLDTATSYISLADANDYFAKLASSSDNNSWSAIGDEEKEGALMKASRFLDQKYHGKWKGIKVRREQNLAWPRQDVYIENGEYWVDSTVVPDGIKYATCIYALRSTTNDLAPTLDEEAGIVRESVSVGPLKETIEYLGSKSGNVDVQAADFELVEYLETVDQLNRS